VIVGIKYPERGTVGVKYFSAGPLDHWGHIGLIHHVIDSINED